MQVGRAHSAGRVPFSRRGYQRIDGTGNRRIPGKDTGRDSPALFQEGPEDSLLEEAGGSVRQITASEREGLFGTEGGISGPLYERDWISSLFRDGTSRHPAAGTGFEQGYSRSNTPRRITEAELCRFQKAVSPGRIKDTKEEVL